MTRGTHKLVLTALFIALVTVATMVIRAPIAATGGYVNVGDTMIFVAGALLGPQVGALAGGIGSALADLLSAPQYAIWSLVVKGGEGLLAGLLTHQVYMRTRRVSLRVVLGLVIAAAWMVLGYFGSYVVMFGLPPALASSPLDMVQGAVSVVLGSLLLVALRRVTLPGQ